LLARRRFDFNFGFHAVFFLILEHHLHSILNFRDDISGAAAARGLTTWDLNHRAGPAPQERAPRPSFRRTSLKPVLLVRKASANLEVRSADWRTTKM
jgi:hypothetical protein